MSALRWAISQAGLDELGFDGQIARKAKFPADPPRGEICRAAPGGGAGRWRGGGPG